MDDNIGTEWEHVKSRTTYAIVGECQLEATNEPAYLYHLAYWKVLEPRLVWARSKREFLDGRFKKLNVQGDKND